MERREERTLMTTIIVTTWFGRRDEAAQQLKRAGLTLTIENTVNIENKRISATLFELWSLTADSVIAGFTIEADKIRAD